MVDLAIQQMPRSVLYDAKIGRAHV
jgi:hypothetical protein